MDEPVHYIVAVFAVAILYRIWAPPKGARQARKAQWKAIKKARKSGSAEGPASKFKARKMSGKSELELWAVPEEEEEEEDDDVEDESTKATKVTEQPLGSAKKKPPPSQAQVPSVVQREIDSPESDTSKRHRRYLYVLGGRFRGRTLATCERLDLDDLGSGWQRVPNMRENRGSLGAGFLPSSSNQSGLPLVVCVGGGGLDANHSSCEALVVQNGSAGIVESAQGGLRREPKDNDLEHGGYVLPQDPTTGQLTRANPVDAASPWQSVAKLAVPRHALSVCAAAALLPSSSSPSSSDGKEEVEEEESGCLYAVGGWCYGKEGSCLMERFELTGAADDQEVSSSSRRTKVEQQTAQTPITTTATPPPSSLSQVLSQRGRWMSLQPMPFPRRLHGVAACASNGCVYVFGGSSDECPDMASVLEYDPMRNAWTHKAPLPKGACCAAATIGGQHIYVGLFGRGLVCYDPRTDSYPDPVLTTLPLPDWHGFCMVSHKSSLYFIGGVSRGKWTSACFKYNTTTGVFTSLPSMTTPRRRLAAVVAVCPA